MIEILKIIDIYDHGNFYGIHFRIRTQNGTQFLKATFELFVFTIKVDSFRVMDDNMRIQYEGWKYAKALQEYLKLQGKSVGDYAQQTIKQQLIPLG
ncbi:MAG TPA: hypothetical protein ACFYEK_01215 [Candidatus Wunengus sp. YC60]|uniref:hypothetical protein n=1 Tax=Candidatus Wunengus sp. YC60 TaxID=3367697 RepID=UPI004024B1AB